MVGTEGLLFISFPGVDNDQMGPKFGKSFFRFLFRRGHGRLPTGFGQSVLHSEKSIVHCGGDQERLRKKEPLAKRILSG